MFVQRLWTLAFATFLVLRLRIGAWPGSGWARFRFSSFEKRKMKLLQYAEDRVEPSQTEDCVLDCPKTDKPCALSTCCGPSKHVRTHFELSSTRKILTLLSIRLFLIIYDWNFVFQGSPRLYAASFAVGSGLKLFFFSCFACVFHHVAITLFLQNAKTRSFSFD